MRRIHLFKRSITIYFMAVLLTGWLTIQSPEHGLSAGVDTSGPVGTWYLNANSYPLTAIITEGATAGTYQGTLINESGGLERLDNISWDAAARRIEFRRNGMGFWQWHRGSVVEGILVGRFSHNEVSSARPPQLTSYFVRLSRDGLEQRLRLVAD